MMLLGRSCCAALLVLAACGKPVDATGKEDGSFTKAGMGLPPLAADDPNRPLAADLAVEPLSMLVMFNRLHTADKLSAALNKTPGQFSKVDIDKDKAFDPLSVKMSDGKDGHNVEIYATPPAGEYIVATLLFDPGWEFVGHYSGFKNGKASTVGLPLLSSGVPKPVTSPVAGPPATPPPVVASTPTPLGSTPPVTAPPPSATPTPAAAPGSPVTALPAGSGSEPGVKSTP